MSQTFEAFFREHYDSVERGVRASGVTPEVAADAAQEAFIRAYPRWWRLSRYTNPAAWVQRVAINVSRDVDRKDRRHVAAIEAIEMERELEPTPVPQLDDAVQTLPTRQREVVEAYYRDGLSTTEAAEEMGISAGAVRFHLSEARNNLRPQLATLAPRQNH